MARRRLITESINGLLLIYRLVLSSARKGWPRWSNWFLLPCSVRWLTSWANVNVTRVRLTSFDHIIWHRLTVSVFLSYRTTLPLIKHKSIIITPRTNRFIAVLVTQDYLDNRTCYWTRQDSSVCLAGLSVPFDLYLPKTIQIALVWEHWSVGANEQRNPIGYKHGFEFKVIKPNYGYGQIKRISNCFTKQ